MRTWYLWTVIAVAATSAASSPDAKRRPISTSSTVAAVYRDDMGLHSDGTPKLILAVWSDGESVWSADGINGGSPYHSARISSTRAAKLFSQFEHDGLFLKSKQRRSYFGPDSTFVSLLIRKSGKEFRASSWHEVFEAKGAVAKASGISPNGRFRLETLASEPAEYVHFRMLWAETRLALERIRPSSGKPVTGKIEAKGGRLTWVETSSEK